MQLLPDTRLVPEAEIVSACLSATTAEVGGQVTPGDAGLQDEQDAREDLAVIQRLTAGKAKAATGRRRQQRGDFFPELIGDQRFHGSFSLASEGYPQTTKQLRACLHFFRTL